MKDSHRPRRSPWRIILPALIALLLGAALRSYRLDAQSFWNDEGNTARLVERSLRLIVEGAGGDIHPPGYYLLLHGWWLVAGGSEYALRYFSALCGVLTIAVAAALGRRAGGGRTAVGAAFLVALHPLAVYYGQEARMYALLGLVSALTLLMAFQVQRPNARRRSLREHLSWGLGLALVILLGLYTQYAFGFVLLAINSVFLPIWLSRRPLHWRTLWIWSLPHLAGGLTFLPWLPFALKVTAWRPPDLETEQRAFAELSRTLLAGVTLPLEAGTYLLPVAGLLLLLALLRRARSRFLAWASFVTALLPAALLLLLDLYRPAYLKFLMVSIVPLAVSLALSLGAGPQEEAARRRRVTTLVALLLLLALIPGQVRSLHHLYFDPAYARDDYRGIAARIAEQAGSRDAILLNAPNQWEVFTYYFDGPQSVYPAPYHPQPEDADAWVGEILQAGHPHLFVLYWGDTESDPERRIELRLALRAYKASEAWVDDVRLAIYGTAPLPKFPTERMDARLGEGIDLEGTALPERTLKAGDVLPVTFFWRVEEPPGECIKVFVHLFDGAGELVAQTDAEPLGGFRPTSTWESGETLIDRYGVLLPHDVPPGRYTLEMGMYYLTGERLPVTVDGKVSGDTISLGAVEVTGGE